MYSTAPADWVTRHLLVGGVLPLSRDAVGVFYSPSRLDHKTLIGGGSFLSPEMQSVYSTAPADWVTGHLFGGESYPPLQRCSRCILLHQPTGPLDTHWGKSYPLQSCSLCILQPQPTRPQDTYWGRVLPLSRDAVGVFNSSSRLGHGILIGGRGLAALQRCSRCILQLQPT